MLRQFSLELRECSFALRDLGGNEILEGNDISDGLVEFSGRQIGEQWRQSGDELALLLPVAKKARDLDRDGVGVVGHGFLLHQLRQ